jgi:hypothetical protein
MAWKVPNTLMEAFLSAKKSLRNQGRLWLLIFLHGWDNSDNDANYAKIHHWVLHEQDPAFIIPY